ncbi:MAG TPA: non-canonical purine NTP pyrophosphatase [Polyangiaceae bacterium]|jgi:XTP/dITP diphosphohydrolase|nr:non-canonical purine NTP pyrophosphatase [Polyangiaceae bacterium]
MEPRRRHRERLVVATGNRGKLEELRALLSGLALEVQGVGEILAEPPHVVEDGATFAENATKKAIAVARATMMLSLADDSGLEVDALDGRPGVKSARFAHDRATDAENNAALLAQLEALDAVRSAVDDPGGAGLGPQGLRARFRCVLALLDPFTGGGQVRIVQGVCEGAITRTPRGSGGFGYDPLFVVNGTEQTMAELDPERKNRISHRAAAFAALRPVLQEVLDERADQLARLG